MSEQTPVTTVAWRFAEHKLASVEEVVAMRHVLERMLDCDSEFKFSAAPSEGNADLVIHIMYASGDVTDARGRVLLAGVPDSGDQRDMKLWVRQQAASVCTGVYQALREGSARLDVLCHSGSSSQVAEEEEGQAQVKTALFKKPFHKHEEEKHSLAAKNSSAATTASAVQRDMLQETAEDLLQGRSLAEQEADWTVCSHNEWDPLEQVIVGTVEGAMSPPQEPAWQASCESDHPLRVGWGRTAKERAKDIRAAKRAGEYKRGMCFGDLHTDEEVQEATKQLNNFVRVLQQRGVSVRRADENLIDNESAVETPDFYMECQSNVACPRDLLLVLGDQIMEAPMSLRSRFFEFRCYRPLLKRFWEEGGALWTTAPKPRMGDDLYRANYPEKDSKARCEAVQRGEYITTEVEPIFDAADILRCGRDLFVQHGQTTNLTGIRWLQRYLGREYKLHPVRFPTDLAPVHIDATFVVPAPGIAVENADRIMSQRSFFTEQGWRVFTAPCAESPETHGVCSSWISMNTLSLDDKTLVLEATERRTIEFFRSLGFKVCEVPFDYCYDFGGSFHCYTTDTRRRGELQSYFKPLDTYSTALRPWSDTQW